MTNTWKPMPDALEELIRKLDAKRWAENKKPAWRPARPEPNEGQFEAIARREDARRGFGNE